MRNMIKNLKNEPVLLAEAVKAALAVAVAFGLQLSAEQTASLLVLVGAVLAIVARSKVSPTSKVVIHVDDPEFQEILEADAELYDFDPGQGL